MATQLFSGDRGVHRPVLKPIFATMNLPRRQQVILDRMDHALGAADPQLRSRYAAFTRRAGGAPLPAAEVIATRPVRFLVLALIVLLAIGVLALGVSSTSGGCAAPAWHGTCTSTATTSGPS
jgi:hypothetical protein